VLLVCLVLALRLLLLLVLVLVPALALRLELVLVFCVEHPPMSIIPARATLDKTVDTVFLLISELPEIASG
jgi:hypothetical protein